MAPRRRNFGPHVNQDFMTLGTDEGGFGFGDKASMIGGDYNPGGAPMEGGDPGGIADPQDPFGNGQDRPDAFFALSPEEQQAIIDLQAGAIAGNQETAREFGGGGRPTTSPTAGFNLPRGVSVEERAGPEASFSQDTPAMSMEPAPISAGMPEPMQTQTAPQGPQRRSVSNAAPALFAESGGGRMFGDAGGLMSGGRGVVGSSAGGPTPTEMMLAIMRSLRGGG